MTSTLKMQLQTAALDTVRAVAQLDETNSRAACIRVITQCLAWENSRVFMVANLFNNGFKVDGGW